MVAILLSVLWLMNCREKKVKFSGVTQKSVVTSCCVVLSRRFIVYLHYITTAFCIYFVCRVTWWQKLLSVQLFLAFKLLIIDYSYCFLISDCWLFLGEVGLKIYFIIIIFNLIWKATDSCLKLIFYTSASTAWLFFGLLWLICTTLQSDWFLRGLMWKKNIICH